MVNVSGGKGVFMRMSILRKMVFGRFFVFVIIYFGMGILKKVGRMLVILCFCLRRFI